LQGLGHIVAASRTAYSPQYAKRKQQNNKYSSKKEAHKDMDYRIRQTATIQ